MQSLLQGPATRLLTGQCLEKIFTSGHLLIGATNPNALVRLPMESRGSKGARGCWSEFGRSLRAVQFWIPQEGFHAPKSQDSCCSQFILRMQGKVSTLTEPMLGTSKPEELAGVQTSQGLLFPSFTCGETEAQVIHQDCRGTKRRPGKASR